MEEIVAQMLGILDSNSGRLSRDEYRELLEEIISDMETRLEALDEEDEDEN